jgi:hypothetical protein
MRIWQKITLIAIVISLLIVSARSRAIALPFSEVTLNEVEEARAKIRDAFNATVFAEQIGTNVDEAAEKMNNALEYINQAENLIIQGDLEQANALTQASIKLSEETINSVQELKIQKGLLNFWNWALSILVPIILIGFGVCAFFFGRRFCKKRKWKKFMEMKVKPSNVTMPSRSTDSDSRRDVDEEKMILVAVLSAIIVVGGLVVYVSLTPAPQESFVSIYLLSLEKRAEYPELLVLGKNSTFSLLIGVENSMRRIEYGVIEVKIFNQSIPTGQQQEDTLMHFEKILLNGETWEIPFTTTIDKIGLYRIRFELSLYDNMKAVFANKNFCSLPLEVIS